MRGKCLSPPPSRLFYFGVIVANSGETRVKSITQTRLHFQNIVAGFTEDDEKKYIDWTDDFTPHPPKPGEEGKQQSRKGKERVRAGGGNGVAGGSGGSPVAKGAGGSRSASGSGAGSGSASKKKRRSGAGM